MRFLLFFLISILGCYAESKAAPKIPFMDLIEYRNQLFRIKGKKDDSCSMNLRVRSKFRDLVLKNHHNYEWLVSKENYSEALRAKDKKWSQAFQNFMLGEKSKSTSIENFYPGDYTLSDFASYQIGSRKIDWYKDRGYTFKVFFEFKNPQIDLNPSIYRKFSKELSLAGFVGDSKIPLINGWIRFGWNNIIVHATSIEAAKIAEKVGLEFFGKTLESYSRGIDKRDLIDLSHVEDWPNFLCAGNYNSLPQDILKYVRNQ